MKPKDNSLIIGGHKAYISLILAAILVHIIQAAFFYYVHCYIPTIYNILSVFFYAVMLYLCRLGKYKICVTAVHLEIMVFASITTVFCGWGVGTPLYLVAAASLVYFCPFECKYIPYIFSVMECTVFVLLCFHSFWNGPIYTQIPTVAANSMLIINSLSSFFLLIFASYLTNISASVTNQRLLAENKTLTVMANYDFLTGLYSRRAFLERLNSLPAQANLVLAMGDLDDFKRVNDTYGHSTGDYVLRTISQLITKYCSNKTVVCRWGGEEFIFYFQNMTFESAQAELELLGKSIAEYPFSFDGHCFNITITFGLTQGLGSIDHIICDADSLLYEGKHNGKNQVYVQ